MDALLYVMAGLCTVTTVLSVVLMGNQKKAAQQYEKILKQELDQQQRALRLELSETVQSSVRALGGLITENQKEANRAQGERLLQMQKALMDMSAQVENRLKTSAMENEQKLELIRGTVEKRLSGIQADNNQKLDEMRQIVDEKLQKTLDARMTQSFQLVNERLEQVYKGLGEMQSLAVGVGDLKKVLSNVKTRGTLGEIQLGAILAEILAPEQYDTNVATSSHGRERVEFAIKLPADDGVHVYMPIDSKFPMDAYTDLIDAYESGSPERVHTTSEVLKARIRSFAKDIRDKYIDPPNTTEFGIMFLPTEGLYAEVVKLGMLEKLQRDYRVSIAGPSTMAAMLNSFQMTFRSVAIQRRSSEVWKVLSAVKTEFERFTEVLSRTQKQLTRANNELDTLVGVRTRRIQSSLKDVLAMPESEAAAYLPPEVELWPEEPGQAETETETA